MCLLNLEQAAFCKHQLPLLCSLKTHSLSIQRACLWRYRRETRGVRVTLQLGKALRVPLFAIAGSLLAGVARPVP